ncbi:hypothetical protein M011DRAFT_379814, partial [Sporormia fimetaria CBS 119925]
MPSDEENIKYLYTVLTYDGAPNVDWDKVSTALDLKKGATTKRWSRLKKAMEEGKDGGPAAQQLLWLMMKYSTREKAPDWTVIADKCGIPTAGAASKRYSRMKQAFESGAAPSAVVTTPSKADKSTPKRKRADKAQGDDEDSEPETPTKKPAVKRALRAKKPAAEDGE